MRALFGVVMLLPALALAEPVAVVPFSGLHADEPQLVVLRMLKKRARLVPSGDIGDAHADLIVTGTVEHAQKLTVVVYLMKSGQLVGTLSYPIKGRHLSREQLLQLAKEVSALVSQGLQLAGASGPAAPPESDEEAEKAAEEAVAQMGDTEAVPLSGPEVAVRAQPRAARPPRPVWAPIVEVSLGAIVDSRAVRFSPAEPRAFDGGVGAGVHFDATIYPLAPWHHRFRGLLAGLGGGITVDKPFWQTTVLDDTQRELTTSELRVEGGLRWKFVLRRALPRLELTALAGAGTHQFRLGRGDLGPPSVSYVFGGVGLLVRLYVREWVSLFVGGQYFYVPDSGSVEDVNQYGLADTHGGRFRAGLDFKVWRGLKLGGEAYYEQIALRFTHGEPTVKTADRATDQYYGGIFFVGYAL